MFLAIFNSNKIPQCRRLNYEFTERNCYAQKFEICPLEKTTLQEIEKLQKPNDCIRRNEKNYCLLMEKAMLNDTLQEYMPVSIYHFVKCGHFFIDDGRHRICITEHLHKNGIEFDLPTRIYEEKTKCAQCKRSKEYD